MSKTTKATKTSESTKATKATKPMKQTQAFQAEVKQLLHLVTHSLYSHKEIFLRELVSNASDACDKLRFEAIDTPALYEDQAEMHIRITVDPKARTLTISDNGIGMSMEEAISHLGTIAKSGTKDFLDKLEASKQKDAHLIGQFGVGFYSGFIVADHIAVETRRAGLKAKDGVRWQSDGSGEFDVENITKEGRGTDIILHLREGEDEWLESMRVRQIVNQYSDHISLPIQMHEQEWDQEKSQYIEKEEWETINQANALWVRPRSEITPEQYAEFYKQTTWDGEAPMAWSHNRVEGTSEYTQLLYIPAHAPMDLWHQDSKAGVKLYVKRVFIMDDVKQLLPNYLRFVKGVIDSSDLPLNVSRELLQDSRDVRMIKEGSTRRILSLLEEYAHSDDAEQQAAYEKFWGEFGAVLKEGIGEDQSNRERIAKLMRVYTTQSADKLTSLSGYIGRMKEGQKEIYYVTADNLVAAQNSPQLEAFNAKGVEVILLTDRVDEWMLNFLQEFDGKPLHSVAKGTADLGELQTEDEKKQVEEATTELKPLLEKLKEVLKDKASDVRLTTRLVSSPACVVVADGALSSHLTRMLQQAGQAVPETLPILELNAEHDLVKRLSQMTKKGKEDAFEDYGHVIFDQAVLAEGGALTDPAAYVKRVNKLLS